MEDGQQAIPDGWTETHAPEKRVVEGPGSRLRRIDLDKDLRISSIATPSTLGDKNVTGSWIWSVFDGPAEGRTRASKKAKTYSSGRWCSKNDV